MAYWNVSAINGTTPEQAYVGVAIAAPWMFPLVLFFQFMLILLSGVGIQSRRIGFANVPMWGTIAGLVTTTTGFFWTAMSAVYLGSTVPLINIGTIGVCFAVTIGFAALFFLTDVD